MKKGAESLNSVGVGPWQPAEEGSYQGSVRLDDVLEHRRGAQHGAGALRAPGELVLADELVEAGEVLVQPEHVCDRLRQLRDDAARDCLDQQLPTLAAISLWGRSAAVDDWRAKARAERLAIFVGLWPPTFFLLGKVMQDLEASPAQQVLRARGVDESQLDEALRHEVAAVPSSS
jgi:hypothetical protein